MLLNWYVQHIQENYGTSEHSAADFSMANCNLYFRDPEEGNKTHAYLQLEGLIQLDKSQQSVNYTYRHSREITHINIIGWLCWCYLKISTKTGRRRNVGDSITADDIENFYKVRYSFHYSSYNCILFTVRIVCM